MRGDDVRSQRCKWTRRGTPPRARGRPSRSSLHRPPPRNTPACAGTTASERTTRVIPAEHPRVRGDDPPPAPLGASEGGTPPRARGRPPAARRTLLCERNTPACAGTTVRRSGRTSLPPEHPRVRGDDLGNRTFHIPDLGTPPRARGRRRRGPPGPGVSVEHPRVRGDDSPAPLSPVLLSGTPPRARGRPGYPSGANAACGNTPACAGTTKSHRKVTEITQEHPRVRGDDVSASIPDPTRRGTPPRARGRRPAASRADPRPGNTPACAGTTRSPCVRQPA